MLRLLLCFSLINFCQISNAQIGIGVETPDQTAMLEVSSANGGFLPPRMTFAQRNAVTNPAAGLIIYCTDCDTSGQTQIYNGTRWTALGAEVASRPPFVSVRICDLDWLDKNLSVSTYRNGDSIPEVKDNLEWANLTTGAWCWYNNDSANYASFGKLYNWYAVNDPRGLAPEGWRLATDDDWNQLALCIDPTANTTCIGCSQSAFAGGELKETGTTFWNSPNTGATNSKGFGALGAGGRRGISSNPSFPSGGFSFNKTFGYWWTTDQSPSNSANAIYRYIRNNLADFYRFGNFSKAVGLSVRCVRN